MQYDKDGLSRVISYFSKKLRAAEVRYSVTDREALGIVLACRHFNNFLWGGRVTIRTGHQPFVSVFKQRTKSPCMNRWILEMRDYHYKIEYKAGKKKMWWLSILVVLLDQFK